MGLERFEVGKSRRSYDVSFRSYIFDLDICACQNWFGFRAKISLQLRRPFQILHFWIWNIEKSYFCSWPRRMCYQKLLRYDWGPSHRLQLCWRNFVELKLLWVTTIYSSFLAYFIVNWSRRQCFSSSEGLIIGSNCVMVTMTQIPPRIDPLSSMSRWVGGGGVSKKVGSNLLKIGQIVAYG